MTHCDASRDQPLRARTVPRFLQLTQYNGVPDGRTSAYRPKAHRVGEDGRGAVTRLERRGGVAIAFMAAALWIMLLIAAREYLF